MTRKNSTLQLVVRFRQTDSDRFAFRPGYARDTLPPLLAIRRSVGPSDVDVAG
jgi:hypothetical protein